MEAFCKNEVLMAHMFLRTPAFMKTLTQKFPKMFSSTPIDPCFLVTANCFSALSGKETRKEQKSSSGEPSQHSSSNFEHASPDKRAAEDWYVVANGLAKGPFSLFQSVCELIKSTDKTLFLKSGQLNRVFSYEFFLQLFQNFLGDFEKQLSSHPKMNEEEFLKGISDFPKHSLKSSSSKNQLQLELGNQADYEEDDFEEKQSNSPISEKKMVGTASQPSFFQKNLAESGLEANAQKQGLKEKVRLEKISSERGLIQRQENQREAIASNSSLRANEAGQRESIKIKPLPPSQAAHPQNTTFPEGAKTFRKGEGKFFSDQIKGKSNLQSFANEDSTTSSINFEEVFSLCEVSSRFFKKIQDDNRKFFEPEKIAQTSFVDSFAAFKNPEFVKENSRTSNLTAQPKEKLLAPGFPLQQRSLQNQTQFDSLNSQYFQERSQKSNFEPMPRKFQDFSPFENKRPLPGAGHFQTPHPPQSSLANPQHYQAQYQPHSQGQLRPQTQTFSQAPYSQANFHQPPEFRKFQVDPKKKENPQLKQAYPSSQQPVQNADYFPEEFDPSFQINPGQNVSSSFFSKPLVPLEKNNPYITSHFETSLNEYTGPNSFKPLPPKYIEAQDINMNEYQGRTKLNGNFHGQLKNGAAQKVYTKKNMF